MRVTTHVVMYSGGIGSWATAHRVWHKIASQDEKIILLFADTLIEDEDLYRFLEESANLFGFDAELVKISEGRTPWEVFDDVKLIGNTRADPCSRILKRALMRKWLEDNCNPKKTRVHIGFSWDEYHRFERAKKHWDPWLVQAPLTEPPYLTREDIMNELGRCGVKPPRLTLLGFPHNNCGGFCVKAGQAWFRHLLRTFPDRYRYHEEQEQAWCERHGKKQSILRDRRAGQEYAMSLRTFRERIEAGGQCDLYDWGGCACMEEPEPCDSAGS